MTEPVESGTKEGASRRGKPVKRDSSGTRLWKAMQAKGWTRQRAARAAGVTPATWCDWEAERSIPSAQQLRRLGEVFEEFKTVRIAKKKL